AGLRKALTRQGFEVRDLVLARWTPDGQRGGPAVSTFEESKLDRLHQRERSYERALAAAPRLLQEGGKRIAALEAGEKPLLAAPKKDPGSADLADELEEVRAALTILRARREGLQSRKAAIAKQLEASRKEREGLDEDSLRELQRMSDLPAKLRQALADCDLLLLVRPTLADAPRGRGHFKNLPGWLHHVDPELHAVLEEFVKSGKPLLACVG